MTTATVNKIIPFSSVDGTGNRTAIFLQGCGFNCQYCHNPETIHTCIHCGTCVPYCKPGALTFTEGRVRYDITQCVLCDECFHHCPHGASPRTRDLTAEQVMDEVRKNMPFIRGITVSGGECTRWRDFLVELLGMAKAEGLHTLLDSNGSYDFSADGELMRVCDGVMLDVKSWDGGVFHALTGGENDTVKQNLRYLYDTGKLEEVRIVCLPGYVDAEATVDGIADTLGDVSKVFLKLIRFRPFGVRGDLEGHPAPSMAFMNRLKARAESRGFRRVLIL